MSWIKDVRNEIISLDISVKSLKKFGLTIGTIFLSFGIFFHWKNIFFTPRIFLDAFGIILLTFGLLNPIKLKLIYKIWMGFAFALGWIVSRFILIILFYFVLTPIGIIAKIFGKEFLDIKFKDGKNSYWIEKKSKTNYEKLY